MDTEISTNDLVKKLIGESMNKNLEFDLERYTRLVVQECCEVAHCNFHVDGLTLGNIMREHFGINEDE